MKNFVDPFLCKIKINRKPLSLHRLQWWLVIVITRLFGRKVQIEGTEGKSLRVFPIVWGKKLHLLGSERDFLQIDYSTRYTLRIKTAPSVVVTDGEPIHLEPSRRDLTVHVVLCHLTPQKTELILRHLHEVGKGYEIVLAYGGTAENFSKINHSNKVFIPDPSVRGRSNRISYYDLIARVRDFLEAANIDPEWIFISDFDLLPLKEAYLEGLISLMKSQGVGFGGKLIRDVSLSNNGFLVDAAMEGILEKMPLINRVGRKPVYHCLGSGIFFHRTCFDAASAFRNELAPMNFELTVPTVAALKGFRLLSFDKHSDVFQQVRYRPVFSCAEAIKIADAGYAFIHPVKEIEEFLKTRDDLSKMAQRPVSSDRK